MRLAYVTLYTWNWEPIGQVRVDLSRLERDGEIDRSDLDDAIQREVTPLLEKKGIKDVYLFVHEGDQVTPEELLESAKGEYAMNGPYSVSWGRNRRVRRPGPIAKEVL